jgi:hypothetical protein
MFLNLIKNFFLKKKLRITPNAINNNSNEIVIIINANDISNSEFVIDQLTHNIFKKYKVTVIYYKNKFDNIVSLPINNISNKTFNWCAKVTDNAVLNLLKQPYLLCVTISNDNLYVNRISNIINAEYKFEVSNLRSDIFDVSLIYTVSENSQYINDLTYYLKSFKIID